LADTPDIKQVTDDQTDTLKKFMAYWNTAKVVIIPILTVLLTLAGYKLVPMNPPVPVTIVTDKPAQQPTQPTAADWKALNDIAADLKAKLDAYEKGKK
jgi:hypothetical protein